MKNFISSLPEEAKDRAIEALTDFFRSHYFNGETECGRSLIYGDSELSKEQLNLATAICFGVWYGFKPVR